MGWNPGKKYRLSCGALHKGDPEKMARLLSLNTGSINWTRLTSLGKATRSVTYLIVASARCLQHRN
jgi:hypothetical protein